MKNYLAFYGSWYYPSGGMEDFFGSFDDLETAIKEINIRNEKVSHDRSWEYTWAHVYSIEENKIVFRTEEN